MPAVLVASSEFSIFETNAPLASDVEAAMRQAAPIGRRNPRLGNWVGPAPRVTRKAVMGGVETDASWLYAWPDTDYTAQNLADLQNLLKGQVDQALLGLSSTWSQTVLTPYSATLHGSVDWWASGQAANTQTRVITPTGISRLSTPENPIGPTTDDTHPTTILQAARGIFQSPLTWVIVGGVALLVAWPYLKPFLPKVGRAA